MSPASRAEGPPHVLKEQTSFYQLQKKNQGTPPIARRIAKTLEETCGYQIILNIVRIPTATECAKHIYTNMHRSDVLIVLLESETATLERIQREIAVARGAHVSILPLAVVDPGTSTCQQRRKNWQSSNCSIPSNFRAVRRIFSGWLLILSA